MLFQALMIFLYFHSISALNFSEGRSYFFKTKTNAGNNNEFTVYNRMHFLNHNISDYDVNPHPPQNIKVVKVSTTNNHLVNNGELRNGGQKKFYLDPEWDYDHDAKPINKSQLPVFIKKIYEQRLRDTNKTDTVRIFFNSNRNHSKIIKFDLDQLKAGENVTDADMYFYWPLENTSSIFKTSVVLKLYQFEQLDNSALNESNLVENPDIHKLFNVIYIAKAQKGWQTFKIKKPLDNWKNGEANLGLLLTISTYDDNKLISIFDDTNQGASRTFAVLNIENRNVSRSTSINQTLTSSKLTAACSKRPFQINFGNFHWDKFVLYPENGLATYECAGKCHNFRENNHVKLRLLAHGTREKICCVPTGYWSYPIMFADKFGNFVLKNYDEVVVKQCGCR